MARRAATPLEVQLDEGAERLLRWLERYPFQRAQDLVVALAPWQKRTAVYERLAMLESLHLIETLLAGAASGKRLYHLSPLGMRLCDQLAAEANRENQEKQARWKRWEARGNAQIIREERDKLVHRGRNPSMMKEALWRDPLDGLCYGSIVIRVSSCEAMQITWESCAVEKLDRAAEVP